MKSFIEYFKIILAGDKEASRQAARDVRKLLYSSHDGQYEDIKSIIENAPQEYPKVREDWRQENFVMAVSVLYFLHEREDEPDFLFPWLFHLLQHRNGNVRRASSRMMEHEFGALSVHIRFPGKSFDHKFTEKQADDILFSLFMSLVDLTNELWKPIYKKYNYIDSLPASPYKSVQMILGEMENRCGKAYMKLLKSRLIELNSSFQQLSKSVKKNNSEEFKSRVIQMNDDNINQLDKNMAKETANEEIIETVEKKLENLLGEYKLSEKMTVKNIKDWIWSADGETAMEATQKFQKKWMIYFSHVEDIEELNRILQIFVGAWNYFPHKVLGGKSPNEKVQEMHKKNPELANNKQDEKFPDFVVGGQKIPWDKYWAMIEEMEKEQVPFKAWIDKDLSPKYKKFLEQTAEKNIIKNHEMVARIFFERVLQVGFVEFEMIRKDFIQKEFPHWWQTHVMLSELSEKEVLDSLKNLFQFIDLVYKKDIKIFGF